MIIQPHLDDVGVTAGSVDAWKALREAGVVRSASTMVPCPYYPMARDDWGDHPDQDMGVHITLTSEWTTYRWRPLLGNVGGLTDSDGYFHHRPDAVMTHADPKAVADEMAAQLDRVLSDGLRPTHMDAHMGTALFEPFVWSLIELGKTHDIPVLVCRNLAQLLHAVQVPVDQGFVREVVKEAETLGWPVFDQIIIGFCAENQTIETHVNGLLDSLESGVGYYALHADTAVGMDSFAPLHTRARQLEYEFFSDPASRDRFAERNIQLATWQELSAL